LTKVSLALFSDVPDLQQRHERDWKNTLMAALKMLIRHGYMMEGERIRDESCDPANELTFHKSLGACSSYDLQRH